MRLFKRASLDLSINAIIIIVLAFTLLGLGLFFIRDQIGQIGATSTAVQEQIKQQILDDLRTGNKKLSFPVQELSVQPSGEDVIAIGIKNVKDTDLNFKINIWDLNLDKDTYPDGGSAGVYSQEDGCADGVDGQDNKGCFFLDGSDQLLSVGDSQVFGIKTFAPGSSGSYLYKLIICHKVDVGVKVSSPGQKFCGASASIVDSNNLCNDADGCNEIYDQKTFFVKVN